MKIKTVAVGEKYKSWTVLEYLNDGKGRWLCKCACGTLRKLLPCVLKNTDKFKMCMQCTYKSRIVDITGRVFGKWKVLRFDTTTSEKQWAKKWICQCECGRTASIFSSSLLANNSHSCQYCMNRKPDIHTIFRRCYESAIKRGIEFNLSKDYLNILLKKQKNKCALSNIVLNTYRSGPQGIKCTASIDRIDSSKGYIEGNVQWVHKNINYMKWNLTQKEFINWCKLVALHN